EGPAARHGRLVTTGLIDPNECHWGRRVCRFLGRDYANPAVEPSDGMPNDLRRRVERARRPKRPGAGPSERGEGGGAAAGGCPGGVGRLGVWGGANEVAALRRLADWLHSAEVARLWRDELGANAVGGGDTVTTRAFLRGVRLPVALP